MTLYCQAWAKNIDTERIYVDKVTKTNLDHVHYDVWLLCRGVPMEAAAALSSSRCPQSSIEIVLNIVMIYENIIFFRRDK